MNLNKGIVFIVGPTGSGKTAVSLALAKKAKAEIICLDSMQIYRGMDILSSQPTLLEKKAIKHHLFAQLSPAKNYDVSLYRTRALSVVNKLIKKNKLPIFVGGTGLYMSMLVDGIFEVKISNQEKIRRGLYKIYQEKGSRFLYAWLTKVDAQAASKIHPNDAKRIIRALEVFLGTGNPISYLQKQRKGLADKFDLRMFCLDMPRDQLYSRISARVDRMCKNGLVAEVKRLMQKKISRTAGYALGIKEIKAYLDDKCSLAQAIERLKRNTRLYAKRQLTWFRKDKRIQWIQIKSNDSAGSIANKIYRLLR